jgi:hypothetical protein
MPELLGFILGVAVTILGVYEYDSSTGRAGNGLTASAAGGKAPMVNWDVVSDDWQNLQSRCARPPTASSGSSSSIPVDPSSDALRIRAQSHRNE